MQTAVLTGTVNGRIAVVPAEVSVVAGRGGQARPGGCPRAGRLRAAIWVLYATYTWTAAPGLSTLQAARFYVPALGAISLLGAWLLVRVPRRQPVAAVTTLAVVAALCGLGGWAFHDMYQFPFGSQLVVVPGPGGTVELEPGPGVMIGGPGRVAPGGSGRAVRIGPSGKRSARTS